VAGGSAPLAKHICGNVQVTYLCGHTKQRFLGAQNQSLATWVEVGFLGSLGPVAVSTPLLLNFLEQEQFPVTRVTREESMGTSWAMLPICMLQESTDKGWNRTTPQELIGVLRFAGVVSVRVVVPSRAFPIAFCSSRYDFRPEFIISNNGRSDNLPATDAAAKFRTSTSLHQFLRPTASRFYSNPLQSIWPWTLSPSLATLA
jgi:hypothetical protein